MFFSNNSSDLSNSPNTFMILQLNFLDLDNDKEDSNIALIVPMFPKNGHQKIILFSYFFNAFRYFSDCSEIKNLFKFFLPLIIFFLLI
jgi:hypothetical protein